MQTWRAEKHLDGLWCYHEAEQSVSCSQNR
ncbi:hypothetical protein Pint_03781 [Pistacia integerrima]|uniref:Uncharacterized protein n=2 Tax=Pistacia TaxID=55512 RepID=A0ACC0ZA48_9ROSI|nr:hypothetical protein Pint_03781 [Pistacia integerrima]